MPLPQPHMSLQMPLPLPLQQLRRQQDDDDDNGSLLSTLSQEHIYEEIPSVYAAEKPVPFPAAPAPASLAMPAPHRAAEPGVDEADGMAPEEGRATTSKRRNRNAGWKAKKGFPEEPVTLFVC